MDEHAQSDDNIPRKTYCDESKYTKSSGYHLALEKAEA
jgi:hypothetical protein